jgi:putative ABC transport system permease protein
MLDDVIRAIRFLKATPALTISILLTLVLGIGANIVIFAIVNVVLLRPLPYPEADNLIQVNRVTGADFSDTVSGTQFLFLRDHVHRFAGLAAYDVIGSGLNLLGASEPEHIRSIRVSSEFFQVLGITPAGGRLFTRDDEQPNGERVVILSYQLWNRRFNADRSVIGHAITLGTESYTVVGIAPAHLNFVPASDVWTVLRLTPDPTDRANLYKIVGRMRQGVSRTQAQEDLSEAERQFRNTYTGLANDNERVVATSYQESLVGKVRTALVILFAVAGFVLLIACANIANMLLARSSRRAKEVAIRFALGASRWRVMRQLLVESVLLAFAGAILGLVLSWWGLPLLLQLSPSDLPRIGEIQMDFHVLLFAFGSALLTGLLFGLAPALQAIRTDLNYSLKEATTRGSSTGRQGSFFRKTLVISELAISMVLLVSASLLIESYIKVQDINMGFDPKYVMTMQMSLNPAKYDTTEKVAAFNRQLEAKIEGLPGVDAAASVTNLPTENGPGLPFDIVGQPESAGDMAGETQWRAITARYFEVMRIPVSRGRYFNQSDSPSGSPVAIINEVLAKRFFHDRDPIGQHIVIGRVMGPRFKDAAREIVGVVADVREAGPEKDVPPMIFVPAAQIPDAYTALVVHALPASWVIRSTMDATSLVPAVRQQVLSIDPQQPIAAFSSMSAVVDRVTANKRFDMLLVGFFAGLACILSAIGLYGMMSYSVAERTQELGVRLALGANRNTLIRMIFKESGTLIGIGLIIGLVAAFFLTRVLSSLLFGVKATDPKAFLVVGGVLIITGIVATFFPAIRASQTSPAAALRYE